MFMSAAGKCLYFKKLIFHPALMAWLQRTINQQTYLFLIQHITSNPNPVLGTTEAYTNIKLETILSISAQPLQHKKKAKTFAVVSLQRLLLVLKVILCHLVSVCHLALFFYN